MGEKEGASGVDSPVKIEKYCQGCIHQSRGEGDTFCEYWDLWLAEKVRRN